MKKEYVRTTFGEWEKTHNPVGTTWVICPKCGWVLDNRGIRLHEIKSCPCCDLDISTDSSEPK